MARPKSTSKIQKQKLALPVVVKKTALALRDPLQKYMEEVNRYPILSPEEEAATARHYQEHQDKESAQKLVLSNLRLVVKLAIEYRNAYLNTLDLIQEGNMGLMRAVQKYDLGKGVRFTSYAAWWVRAFILKYILDNFRLVKVGTTQAQKKLFFNLMKEKERIERLGFVPTAKLLSERMAVKESDVREMELRMGSRELELDAPKPHFEGALNMDFVADGQEAADQKTEQAQLKDILLKHLEEFTTQLSVKEKQIFSQRLFTEVPKTLQDIADAYGITRERIRQIENRLVGKMQKFFAEKGLKVDIDVNRSM